MDNLILTGYGWTEYAVAAAIALKGLDGLAEVAGVSKRRLPELLEATKGVRNVCILGVALGGDEARLAAALKALRRRGVSVTWISAVAASESQRRDVLPFMKSVVDESVALPEVVGRTFGVDAAPFLPYAEDGGRVSAAVRDYRELFEAAQFFYRYYQDETVYAAAIRSLAAGVQPAAWGEDVRRVVEHYRRYRGRELVGKSPQIRTLQERVNRIALFPDARVLILGESGTGKETVAQQIHNKSPRGKEPFYAFNCASVNPSLLESRFFGHEKGAFTGADRATPGLFELANGGTLFLDEIGELPLDAQGILLRVLEGGRFMRVGGGEERFADVRLITATNRNLPARVREGKFRADLYQRLNVVQLRIPALREHKEDIRDIADGWWLGHHHRHLTEEQVAALMDYDYPGNVRELLNLLDRATVLGEDDFAALLAEHREMNAGLAEGETVADCALPDELDAAVRRHVRRVFDKYGQNLSRAAQALKVARNTVKKYLPLVLLCGLSAFAGTTIRSKSDMRLWETVHDRAAPLTWSWAEGADSATLTFSNRVSRTAWSCSVSRAPGKMRGSCVQPAPTVGETVVDVTLVQKAGANEIARETTTLAYVAGAGGGPITVQANPGTRTWTRVREPRVYAVDPAWQGGEGESGYDIAWPDLRGLMLILK